MAACPRRHLERLANSNPDPGPDPDPVPDPNGRVPSSASGAFRLSFHAPPDPRPQPWPCRHTLSSYPDVIPRPSPSTRGVPARLPRGAVDAAAPPAPALLRHALRQPQDQAALELVHHRLLRAARGPYPPLNAHPNPDSKLSSFTTVFFMPPEVRPSPPPSPSPSPSPPILPDPGPGSHPDPDLNPEPHRSGQAPSRLRAGS